MHFQPIILTINKNDLTSKKAHEYLGELGFNLNPLNIHIFKSEKNTIGIENIAKLNKDIYRVNDDLTAYIIEMAEKMSEEAQNALLKTLEEPNANSLIVLVTLNPDKLLETIRSRCVEVSIREAKNELEEESFLRFVKSSYIERRSLIDGMTKDVKSRELALDLILYIMNYAKGSRPEISEELVEIYKSIKQGTNLKLALENASILLI